MDFLPLSLLFLGAGALAILYFALVPNAENLRQRLPNRVSVAAILLTVAIAAALWYILATSTGFLRTARISTLIFSLLVFETLFLLSIRWFRSNTAAVLVSLAAAVTLFLSHTLAPSFTLLNTIVILATLGAATLLIRLGYLRTPFLFLVTILWTIYDILASQYFFPRILVPVTEPPTYLIFPSVTAGTITLGSGDFMFLVLFTLVILRDLGALPAFILVLAETVGLIITGIVFPVINAPIPFLVVMTPIFFVVYFMARTSQPNARQPTERKTSVS